MGEITAIAAGDSRVVVADKEFARLKTFTLTMDGLDLEERVQVSHSFYVPESALNDPGEMARYRDLALNEVAAELAGMAGVTPSTAATSMRTDRELLLPGGMVQLLVSMPKPVVMDQ